MSKKLKPCPFCGSEAIYETFSQEHALGTKNPEIFCNSCKAIFSIEDSSPYLNCDEDYKYRKQKTIEAWNRRAEPKIIRCGQCKYAEVADTEDSQDGYTCQFHRGSIWFSGSYCSWAERRTDE